MMSNIGKPISRVTLMREVWNMPGEATTNVVDVYMKYLRDKVDQGDAPKLIRTVRGIGYVLSSN
jgi:DNA-binding response OmpR family regulator